MGVISLAVGPSLPTGEYGNKGQESLSGNANLGLAFNIDFKYRIFKYLGVSSSIVGFLHEVDENALKMPEYGKENFKTYADPWGGGFIMLGPLFSYPYGKFEFDLRVLIGYSMVRRPKQVESYVPYFEAFDSKIYSSRRKNTARTTIGTGMAFGLGAGVRFKVSDKTSLLTNLDFISTNPEMTYITSPGFGVEDIHTVKQPIQMVNLTFGIGFRLN